MYERVGVILEEWQFVDVIRRENVWARSARFGILGAEIKLVLGRVHRVAVVGEVGQVLTEGVSETDRTAMSEPPIERRQQTVIARYGLRLDERDGAVAAKRANR